MVETAEWRPVPWAPRYEVSRDGRVRNRRTRYVLRARGFNQVCLYVGHGLVKRNVTPHLLARDVFGAEGHGGGEQDVE